MAAQDAELQLKVGLDLAFFRQQLSGLGAAAAGYNLPINVKFDRRSIQNELNALGRNISQRTYRLEVATNLDAEIIKAKKLAEALRNIPKGNATGSVGAVQAGFSQSALKQISPEAIKKLYKAAADAGLIGFNEAIRNNKEKIAKELSQVGKDSIEGLLNGFSSEDDKLKAAASSLGKSLIKQLKGTLGIASPSREFRKIGEASGQGFEQGLLRSMEIAERSATRQMQRMLDRLARMALMAAGMSAAEINRQAGQFQGRASISPPSWSASVPPRQQDRYTANFGRALPPGAPMAGMLGGTAFGSQKYLPTALGEELKQVLRNAANAFVDALRKNIRTIDVRDLGPSLSRQGLLRGGSIAGLLPPSVGRTPSPYSTGAIGGESRAELLARREREARMRSALREADVLGRGGAIVPAGGGMPPSGPPPRGTGMSGGMGGGGGGESFARAMGNVRLPGTGVIRELAGEFGEATKQVLLFGTAYKALAFATSFPAQVGQAVGALQSFNNTLKAISPTANEARASNELILSLVERYNIPLQSARDGFTKLYASMQPAGFSGEEVRNMFVGISKAAAAFGMSADKVDRVNYAFAQMASKGQVMSEELKGQLGDVLPGAMAIFTEAAGFKGPDAIQKFSAALEAGAYKGNAMKVLLTNVGTIMNKEFGPGAEGAARTFQGAINRMQNSLTLLYESFEPVALGFLNAVVVPMTNGIREISDGFNAFFKDTAAKTSGGFAIAQELEKLKPSFDGIKTNVAGVIEQFGQFAKIALEVGKVLLQIAGNPVVGYLAKLYAIVLPLNIALGVMRGLWAASALQLVIFNARIVTGTSTLTAFRGMMAATGATAQTTAASIRTAGLTLRTFFATTGVGLVLVGISALIEHFMSMNQKLDETRQKALGAADAIRQMSGTEARAAGQQAQTAYSLIGSIAGRQSPAFSGTGEGKGDRLVPMTAKEFEQLSKLGAIQTQQGAGGLLARRSDILSLAPQAQRLKAEAEFRQSQLRFEERQAQSPAALAAVPEAPPSEKDAEAAAGRAAKTAEQLAQEKYKYEADLLRRNADQEIALSDLVFNHRKTLREQEYSLAEAGQNEWMQREVKFQRDLLAIEMKRIETIRRAQQEAQKATVEAQAAAIEAQAGPMGATGGGAGGGAIFGGTGRVFNAPGWVHGHFQNMNRAALIQDTVKVVMELVAGGVTPELGSGAAFSKGMSAAQVESLVKQGIASHKKYASGIGAVDIFVPENTPVPIPLSGVGNLGGAAGVTGTLPGGTQLMHLDPRSKTGAVSQSSSIVRAERNANDARLAGLEAVQAKEQEVLTTKYAQEVAQGEINLLIKEYVANLAPVEQQKLENALLVERNRLLSTGLSGNILEAEMTMFEATERLNLAKKEANAIIEQNNKSLADGAIKAEEATRLNAIQTERINQLAGATAKYLPLLKEKTALEMQGEFNKSKQALVQRAQILSMPLGMERLGELQQQFPGQNDYAQQLYEIENRLNAIENLRNSLKDVAGGIGNAFGQATKDVLTSSNSIQQTLANLFQSIADSFASMVANMVTEWIKAQAIKGFQSIFGSILGGASGLSGGIDAAASAAASASSNVSSMFAGGAATAIPTSPVPLQVIPYQGFANGGMVTGPTMGLVGEGRYNEAIVPLPNGRSIPVELGGNAGGNTNVIVNVDAKGTNAQGNESVAKELGIVVSAAVKAELVKQRRPGGILTK